MIVSLIIISLLVLVGASAYIHYRLTGGEEDSRRVGCQPADEAETTVDSQDGDAGRMPAHLDDGECCGMHITCERDSLLASVSESIEYYDDDELDAYAGRTPEAYSTEEEEQFRDVLLTLLPDDIAGWARSLQLRGINLPVAVRDELLLIVSEARASR